MQKVEGSNPFSRFRKTCICRSFSLQQSLSSSVSGRTDSGLAVRRSSAASRNRPPLAGQFWFVRTEVILQACRTSGARPAAAVTPSLAATTRSCGQRPPARYQRSRHLGASPVSVRNREVNLGPLRGKPQRAMTPRAVSFYGDGVRRSFAVPITRTLWRGTHTGVIAEGVLSIGNQAFCAHPGWVAGCRPERRPPEPSRRRLPSMERGAGLPLGNGRFASHIGRVYGGTRTVRSSPTGRPRLADGYAPPECPPSMTFASTSARRSGGSREEQAHARVPQSRSARRAFERPALQKGQLRMARLSPVPA
jgi:hypothetical protein